MKCLSCNKEFKSLISHIINKHNLPISQYRLMYNIPTSISLLDEGCGKRLSKEEWAEKLKEYQDSIT